MTTTDDGVFSVAGLPPGTGYSLKASHVGYSPWEVKDVRISLGESMNFKIELPVVTPNARVQAGTSTVTNAVKFDLSSLIDSERIEALPDVNRRLDSLIPLAPAVTENSAGILAFRGEGFTNALYTDGVLASNEYFYQRPGVAPFVTQDAVSEMQVIPSAAAAEFGHSAGGFVNVATRVGSNAFHGSAYEYHNGQGLNSADHFDPGFRPAAKQDQYGLDAGGPALPKMFWFFSGEMLAGESQAVNRITNPLIGIASGTAALPSNCGSPATAAQCAAAIAFIDAQTNRVIARSLRSETGLAKVDYRLNQSNAFSVEANAMQTHAPNGSVNDQVTSNGGLLGYNGTYTDETRFAKAGWTSAPSGNAINQLRVAWYHDRFSDYSNPALLPSTGPIGINIAGTPVGGNPAYPMVVSEQRYEFLDSLNAVTGSHSVTVGAEYLRTEDRRAQVYNRFGTFDYSSLTTFAEDFTANTLQHRDYTDFTQGFGPTVVDFKTPVISAYAQDVWKPLPRLTVDLGVRWEKTMLPKPPATNINFFQTGTIPSTSTDFSPRLGVAYQLDHRTVVRFGLGSYFQPFVGQLTDQLYTGSGLSQAFITLIPTQTGSQVFPKTFATTLTTFPSGSQNVVYAFNKFRNPYTQQATLAIERDLFKGATVTISATRSNGQRLWTFDDVNLNNYSTTKVYTIDNSGGSPVGSFSTSLWTTKAGTNFARVYQVENSGSSRYNALAAQFRQRMAHGLSAQFSYTWSHAIDDVSGPPTLGFLPSTSIPGDFRDDQGTSSFDQRHRAVINWTWQPTLTSSGSPAARFALNGWQISGIATLASGLPETPMVIVDGQQFNAAPNNGTAAATMQYITTLNGSGGWSRVPFEDVNSLRNSSQYVVDARIAKTLPFTDRVKGMVMFEAFNALNKQYSTSLNTIAYTATLGVLRPVDGLGAPVGASGYPYGSNARRAQVAFRVIF